MSNVLTIGNVPMILVNQKYGKFPQRVKAAGETTVNNLKLVGKTALIGGTATFACDKFVYGGKQFKATFPNLSKAAENAAYNVSKGLSYIANTKVGKGVIKAGSAIVKKLAKTDVGKGIKNISEAAAKNPKTAIIVSALSLFGLALIKCGYNQGKIDQKYQSKAALNEIK